MTKIEAGITDTLADLEEDNRRLRVENEKLRLAGNELAKHLEQVTAIDSAQKYLLLARWREALR